MLFVFIYRTKNISPIFTAVNSVAVIPNQSPLSTSSPFLHSLYKPPPFFLCSSKFSFLFLSPCIFVATAGILRRPEEMTGSLVARLVLRRSPPSRPSQFFWRRGISQPAAERAKDAVVPESPPVLPPFDYSPPAYSGPPGDEILAKRREYLSPSIFHFYKSPVRTRRTGYHSLITVLFWFCYFRYYNWLINRYSVVAAERGGGEEAVPVRRKREEVRWCVRRDCYGVLRALPPWCGRGHRGANEAVTALHRSLSQPCHRWFCWSLGF